MKKTGYLAFFALLMLHGAPCLAQQNPQEQVICNLAAGNCAKSADRVQRKLKKLQSDIQKGKKVPADQLKAIEQQLKEIELKIDNLQAK